MKNQMRLVRAAREVSLEQLSALSGIPATRLWRFERDVRDPTAEERAAICKALHVTDRQVWTAPRLAPLPIGAHSAENVA
jgi:transcriptional regulator with XRE-family HTH domain